MNITNKTIPAGTKLYTTLARCCHYQMRRPSGVQAVIGQDGKFAGFAALPAKQDGMDVVWRTT